MFAHDIGPRKRSEAALAASEARFRAVAEAVQEGDAEARVAAEVRERVHFVITGGIDLPQRRPRITGRASRVILAGHPDEGGRQC